MARMSDAEALMWAVEKEPALRSDFCNLTIVDGTLDGHRLQAKLEHAIRVVPRLGQKVVNAPLRLVPPEWVDDAELDLGYHVRRVAVPGAGTMRDLLDAAAALTDTPFDRARPLWEFTVFDGLEGERSALLQKVHHTITDGVGGLRLSLEIVDLQPDAAQPAHHDAADDDAGARPTPLSVARDALREAALRPLHGARVAAGGALGIVTHPTQVPQRVGDGVALATSMRRQVLVTEQARSDVIDDRSLGRHFETFAFAMEPVMAAARALGGSLNDAYVTAVCGALGRYHEHGGSTVGELRMAMPVSTRERGDRGANRFAPTRVLVPIQPVHDVQARFAETAHRLAITKSERALATTDALAGLVGGLPTALLVTLARQQARTIDFAASNLRGSPIPLYLAGAPILASYPFGPRAGSALNITLMSYCGELHMGLNIDPLAIADPEAFVRDLEDSFRELVDVA